MPLGRKFSLFLFVEWVYGQGASRYLVRSLLWSPDVLDDLRLRRVYDSNVSLVDTGPLHGKFLVFRKSVEA